MRPILFELFGVPIFGYGVMLGLSCVLGAHLGVYLGERSGIPAKKMWWYCAVVILIGIVGGRVHELWVLDKLTFHELFRLQHSGRTAYGGFLSATLAAALLAPAFKVRFWTFADAAAPTLPLGLGLTRIGCFLYGCDYGFKSDTWGVCFPKGPLPDGSPPWRDHVAAGLIPPTATESLPVFPAQLAASAVGFVLFGLLLWLWFRRPRREGTVVLAFFGLYGLARACLEALREDVGRGELLGMTTSTTIGLFSVAVTAALLFVPPLANLRRPAGEVLPPPNPDGDGPAEEAKA